MKVNWIEMTYHLQKCTSTRSMHTHIIAIPWNTSSLCQQAVTVTTPATSEPGRLRAVWTDVTWPLDDK